MVLVPFSSGWLSIYRNDLGGTGWHRSRPLFFGVVIDLNLLKILLKMIFSSRPLFFGVVIDRQAQITIDRLKESSRPLFFGVVIDPMAQEQKKYLLLLFSSPFLRGGYRSDTLTNAITTIFQASFLLSKNMTITSTRL